MEHNTRCAVISCDTNVANVFSDVLMKAGYDRPNRSENLGVAKLATYGPSVLMIDFDHFRFDKLESIRQLRFVLPDSAITVVSSNLKRSWARQCHMAGANGVLSSQRDEQGLLAGLQRAVSTGCYTDPGFTATPTEK
jgi:DNA-binding NarL/FixJ family response regulator